ncbi:MAG TPA: hypothetical protein PLC17_02740, partial [Tenuifilaceae bacterium]|nr:hypothetical protein [Tenuifilaceae bacterium]
MKKFINIVLLGLLGTSLVSAQSSADALKFSENFVNGSARYVGMGGAFGALGGDFSSLGSNPAGLGVYRSSEFTISTSFNKGNFTSEYAGSTRNSKQNLLLDNLGVVLSFKPEKSDGTGIVGVNFGIGYYRGGNYNLDSRLNTGLQDYSIMDYWANKANGIDWLTGADLEETSDYDPYNDPAIPLDILTAWKTGMLKYDAANNYFHAPLSGSTLYEFAPYQMIQNEGGKSEYDFSLGLNFEHKFYFGMTLGLQSIDLSRYSLYSELLYNTKDINEPNKFDYLEYAENVAITGSGVNFKLGAIYRPVEWLRV